MQTDTQVISIKERKIRNRDPFRHIRLVIHGAATPIPNVPNIDSKKEASCIKYGLLIVKTTPAIHSEFIVSARRRNSEVLCVKRNINPARKNRH